jgi:ABC-type multidrug transport system fused ATPase/permease subunit
MTILQKDRFESMSKWAKIEQYNKIYSFVGSRGALYLLFGVLAGTLVFGAELAFAYVLQIFLVVMKIIPPGTIQLPSWVPTDNMYLFLGFVTSILMMRGFTQWLNSYLTAASYEIQRDHQRNRLMEWALGAPSVNNSELITLYHQGIESVCNVLSNAQSISVAFSTSILIWLFMLKLSVKTTLIATSALSVIAVLSRLFSRYTNKEGQKLLLQMESINHQLLNNIKNLLLVQIYGTQEKERTILKDKLSSMLKNTLFFQKVFHFKNTIPQIVGFVLICGLSIAATRREWIAPTLMVTYFYLFMRFVQSFSDMVRLSATIDYSMPTATRFAKWWADHAHDGVRNPVHESTTEQQHAFDGMLGWNLVNATFGYPNSNHLILNNFSLKITPGSALVIIGESGSGKSTLLSLLLGLFKPQSGSINLIHKNHEVDLHSARKSLLPHIGYVGSESFLIAGSILDNLLYGLDHTPSEAEIHSALVKSGCDYVFKLKDGLNHMITEQGLGLSAGQKQRLAFARALLRNPKILILDEATANLDSESEKNLIKTLIGLKGTTTIVAVTHREALLELADQMIKLPH